MFCHVLWLGIQVKNPFNSRYDMQLITLQEADITVKFSFNLYCYMAYLKSYAIFFCLHENVILP